MKRFLLAALLLCTLSGYADAAILVFSPNGTYTTKTTLEVARTALDVAGKTVVVTSALTEAQSNITGNWPNDRGLEIRFGGSLLNSTSFAFTDGNTFSSYQGYVFKGAGVITGLRVANPELFGADATGVTNASPAIARALLASNTVQFPAGTFNIGTQIDVAGAKNIIGSIGGSAAQQQTILNHTAVSGSVFSVIGAEFSGMYIGHFMITGGNGEFAIISSRPQSRIEYIYMEPYNGGGIKLQKRTGDTGSWSTSIGFCKWAAPASPTGYTGYYFDVNGGDVELNHSTAIYGAKGVDVVNCQTLTISNCNITRQAVGWLFSSLAAGDTCSIRIGSVQACTIRECYLEAFTNGIQVNGPVQGLNIHDTLIADLGMSPTGSAAIWLKDSGVENVTVMNNTINGTSNDAYQIYTNSASNVLLLNNYIKSTGTNSGTIYNTTSSTVTLGKNTFLENAYTPMHIYDPSSLITYLVTSDNFSTKKYTSLILPASTWKDTIVVGANQAYKVYAFNNSAIANAKMEATVYIDGAGAGVATYVFQTSPAGYQIYAQVSGGKLQFMCNSGSATSNNVSIQRVQ